MATVYSGSAVRADDQASFSGRSNLSYLCTASVKQGRCRRLDWSCPRTLVVKRTSRPKVCASAETTGPVKEFDGMFGKWTLEEDDKKEVMTYRAGLSIAAAALALDAVIVLLPAQTQVHEAVRGMQNAIAAVGASSLGLSFLLIHIYVTPIKRFIQFLWALGFAGGLYLIGSQDLPVTEYIAAHREAVWLVGPLGASITALGIKEGLCYGTPAALGMCLVTPVLCLGHLTGLMPVAGTQGLLCVLVALATVFATGKYKQPIEGDIGDKSVFTFQKLSKEEQERKLAERKTRVDQNGSL